MKATKPSVSSGLSTDTFKIDAAGVYSIYVNTTVRDPSGLVITISQSGSTTASFSTPTTSPLTDHVELNAKFNCAVNDILTVTITSSATIDQPPNLIKSIINLRQGV